MSAAVPHQRTGVCAPLGFRAGTAAAGVRGVDERERPDIAVVLSDAPAAAAGVFTRSLVKAAPVVISQLALRRGSPVRAVSLNSGNANACTGPQGFRDALRMAALTAAACDCDPAEVLVCSTGVIGRPMPMDRVGAGISAAAQRLSSAGGDQAARAIMTTDTVPKVAAAEFAAGGARCTVGGMAKGSGMIHPDMATLLAVLTTDAAVSSAALQQVVRDVCEQTFNCLTVDGDTSTNDTFLLLANGRSGSALVGEGSACLDSLRTAVAEVAVSLVEQLAADAEGATRSIRVRVTGAVDAVQARQAARTVAQSPLVKTAVHGGDPNWGRIVAALGRSGAHFVLDRCELRIGGITVFNAGAPLTLDLEMVRAVFVRRTVDIDVHLGAGHGEGRAWGCDLSAEYVRINADYTT